MTRSLHHLAAALAPAIVNSFFNSADSVSGSQPRIAPTLRGSKSALQARSSHFSLVVSRPSSHGVPEKPNCHADSSSVRATPHAGQVGASCGESRQAYILTEQWSCSTWPHGFCLIQSV